MKKFFFGFLFFIILDLTWSTLYKEQKEISIKHDVFHHHFLPNYSYTENTGKYGKYTIITNSLGFRDSSVREINLKNKDRIIFIGDSFTEGVLLDYKYTLPGLADNYFKKKGIEVLNAGRQSYSPVIYYTKIKYFLEKGLKFSHLVVLSDISDVADEALWYEYDNESKSVKSKERLKEYIEKQKLKNTLKYKIKIFLKKNLNISYTSIKYLDDKIIDRILSPNSENQFIDFIVSEKFTRDKWTILYEEQKEEYNIGIQNSINYMMLLKNILDEHEIKLTIVVYPHISQIYHNDLNSLQVKIWKEFSEKNNVQFLNLFPLFINNKNKDLDFYEKIKKDFIPHDIHWNKNGYKKAFNFFIKNFQY